jgi:hypothetical protein
VVTELAGAFNITLFSYDGPPTPVSSPAWSVPDASDLIGYLAELLEVSETG